MLSVHYYTPAVFAILDKDASWGKHRAEWGTDEDFEELNYYMDMAKTNFVDKGIPVIVGEFAAASKNKEKEMVDYFCLSVCEAIYSRNMCPVYWDVQGVGFYNRHDCKMENPELVEGFMAIKDKYN